MHAQLGPPPVPAENPITEQKRVLGKILFWDERVSSDNGVACGTCHQPAVGGSDPRLGLNPGPDGVTPSPDDRIGSPGVPRRDPTGRPIADPVFGFGMQVTGRAANSPIGAAYASDVFWEGRARSEFVDPETGLTAIPYGGGLESQAVGPIVSHVEMARDGRGWADVRAKLAISHPLSDATDLPADVAGALAGGATYADLFQAAFGDATVSAQRIAFAIGTYERTLVPDQTPWDRYMAGDGGAMTPLQVQGWNTFNNSLCTFCHQPPMFSDQEFHNIGIRPPDEDLGRIVVSENEVDRGRFKTPTLRNGGLKPTFMHNGRLSSIEESVLWYRTGNPDRSDDNLDSFVPVDLAEEEIPGVVDFLTHGLTDPRVAAEVFPFDRPRLHGGALPVLGFGGHDLLQWPPLQGIQRYNVYRGTLQSLRTGGGYGSCASIGDPDHADAVFQDTELPAPGQGFFYLKDVVDSTGAERGLGTNGLGVPRTVLVPCPAP